MCASLAWNTVRPKNFILDRDPLKEFGLKYESVSWKSSENVTIRGWLIPAQSQPARGIVILAHGVDGSRLAMMKPANMLAKSGFSCLIFDFRGRGESGRTNCTIGFKEVDDLLGAVGFIKGRSELKQLPMGVLGHSMGGAVAIIAASREKRLSSVVSESPFASLDHAIANHFQSTLGFAGFLFSPVVTKFGEILIGSRASDVAPIKCVKLLSPRPLMLIEDQDDRLCPPSETQALLDTAEEPKSRWIVPGAGHVQAVIVAPDEYEKRVTEFFKLNLKPVGNK